MWTKYPPAQLRPVTETRLGNTVKSLSYVRKKTEKRFGQRPYICYLSKIDKVSVTLEVKGKYPSNDSNATII